MNDEFLKKAESLKPELYKTEIIAEGDYGVIAKGENMVFDLKNYFVGRCRIKFSTSGGVIDGPAFLAVTFAETKEELSVSPFGVKSTISGAWIQKEYFHLDYPACEYEFDRRYACRYIKVECIDASAWYKLHIDQIVFTEETSAFGKISSDFSDKELNSIDETALRTMRSCMQEVFEDGPKRDRRLWLGDLRLQALVNYQTYKNYDLVKRCLYLFAATADQTGRIKGSVFTGRGVYTEPLSVMFDYPLLFIPTLCEYLCATGDSETAEELYSTAIGQLKATACVFAADGKAVAARNMGWCFIDWDDELDKEACAVAVYIYALKYAAFLSEKLGKPTDEFKKQIADKSATAVRNYYDDRLGFFVGKNGQISYAENAWFCLAEVLPAEERKRILLGLSGVDGALKPKTPYAYHYFIQALIDCGEKGCALSLLREYWGNMKKVCESTFPEIYNPQNADGNPYGCKALLSNCHAWSATPSYFLRKYFG